MGRVKTVGQSFLIVCAAFGAAGVVGGGLAFLVRAVWGMAQATRDNTSAVKDLTDRWHELAPINGRMGRVEAMLLRVWTHLFPGEPPPPEH